MHAQYRSAHNLKPLIPSDLYTDYSHAVWRGQGREEPLVHAVQFSPQPGATDSIRTIYRLQPCSLERAGERGAVGACSTGQPTT